MRERTVVGGRSALLTRGVVGVVVAGALAWAGGRPPPGGAPSRAGEALAEAAAVTFEPAPAPVAAPAGSADPHRVVAPQPTVVPDGPAVFADDLPSGALEIDFVGDVNLGGRVGERMASAGHDYPWTRVRDVLRRADLAVANLECSVSNGGVPEQKEYVFRGEPASLPPMAAAGIDVVSVANNHALDYGRDAFLDTIAHARAAGIATVGGGPNRARAWEPVVVERNSLRVGFVAASRVLPLGFRAERDTPGVASAYEERRLVDAVRDLRARVDVLAVLLHWGAELSATPDTAQVRIARALVDAGADVVAGSHPHVLQPVVRYRGSVIAYSLGNFVFSSGSASGNTSMILRVGVAPDRSLSVARVPVRISGGRPEPGGR